MPIEIRELIIKATVQDNQLQANTTPVAAPSGNDTMTEQQKAAMVEEVLAIIKRKKER